MTSETDINLKDFLEQGALNFFKAANVKGKTAKAVIIAVREAELPNTGKTLILDIEVKKQPWSFPVNKVNLKKLIEIYGWASSKWIGKVITFYKVLVNNPKTKKEVESLRIR